MLREKSTIAGRSLLFNAAFVALNLAGLTFLVMGYHESAANNAWLYKALGYAVMGLSIIGLIIFRGRLLMANVSRVLVGGLFIVSGLVKANDPVGFSYKLEEYFEDGALAYRIKELFGWPSFSLEFLIDSALYLSVIICIAEIVLGVLVIIGGKIKTVSYLMLTMMVFFTFLTWHTSTCDHEKKFLDHDTYVLSNPKDASYASIKLEAAKEELAKEKKAKAANKKYKKQVWVISKSKEELVIAEMKAPQCVDDCGCFGDALKGSVGRSLTPKESLWKDLILLYLVIWIFVAQWIVKPNTRRENLIMVPASMGVVIFFSWVFGWNFPILFAAIALVGALWMLRVGRKFLGNYYGSALFVTLLSVIMVTYVLMYDPIKDYRPYAVGANLKEKMSDGVDGEYLNMVVYKNSKTGKEREFDGSSKAYMDSKIWEDKDWKFLEMRQKTIVKSVNHSIMDFNPSISITDMSDLEKNCVLVKPILDTSMTQVVKYFDKGYQAEGEVPIEEFDLEYFPAEEYDILDTITSLKDGVTDIEIVKGILAQKKIVIVVSRNLDEANWSSLADLKAIQKVCEQKKIPFIMICNATREDINAFRKKNDFFVPVFSMDEIELKIISRSNPAMLVLENAVVTGKYVHRSIPSPESFKTKYLK